MWGVGMWCVEGVWSVWGVGYEGVRGVGCKGVWGRMGCGV